MQGNKETTDHLAARLDRIYCLSGCTAVGKTELALGWSEANHAEIVNCDSLLFYKGLDIGTAKPTSEELNRVPHHLVNILEPHERMDVGRYLELAERAIREIQSRGKKVLVTGGSGFYLKAFFHPVVDGVEVSESTAMSVAELMDQGLGAAVNELQRLNPDGLNGLDTENPRRVAKALERCLESGLTLLELKDAFLAQTNPLLEAPKSLCILEREKEELNSRIGRRVEMMLEDGLVDEVAGLLNQGIEQNPSACNAIGYRETLAYLRGEYDLATLGATIATNTRRLAKKQRTWFRGQFQGIGRRLDLSDDRQIECSEVFD